MTTKRESEVEKELVRRAKALKWDSYKFVSPGRNGVPDRMFVYEGGLVVFLEIKRPGAKPTPLQLYQISLLNAKGVQAGWVDNADDGIRLLESYR